MTRHRGWTWSRWSRPPRCATPPSRPSRVPTLRLVKTADILAELSRSKGNRVVVGFAAETNDLLVNAREKLERKGCDLIVANDVSRSDSTFGADTSRVSFVWPDRTEQLDTLPLADVASAICDRVTRLVAGEGA